MAVFFNWGFVKPKGSASGIQGFCRSAAGQQKYLRSVQNCPGRVHWNMDFVFNENTLWSLWLWHSWVNELEVIAHLALCNNTDKFSVQWELLQKVRLWRKSWKTLRYTFDGTWSVWTLHNNWLGELWFCVDVCCCVWFVIFDTRPRRLVLHVLAECRRCLMLLCFRWGPT